jgi:uncharacterized protein (UPF0147 family)
MRKNCELTDPRSCLNRAEQTELIFVLLARDVSAPAAIRAWCRDRIRRGKNKRSDPQICEARAIATLMEKERSVDGT